MRDEGNKRVMQTILHVQLESEPTALDDIAKEAVDSCYRCEIVALRNRQVFETMLTP
jgi:hypothetical protein